MGKKKDFIFLFYINIYMIPLLGPGRMAPLPDLLAAQLWFPSSTERTWKFVHTVSSIFHLFLHATWRKCRGNSDPRPTSTITQSICWQTIVIPLKPAFEMNESSHGSVCGVLHSVARTVPGSVIGQHSQPLSEDLCGFSMECTVAQTAGISNLTRMYLKRDPRILMTLAFWI